MSTFSKYVSNIIQTPLTVGAKVLEVLLSFLTRDQEEFLRFSAKEVASLFLPTYYTRRRTSYFYLLLLQHTSIGAASLFPDFIPEVGSIFKFTERPIPPYKPPR